MLYDLFAGFFLLYGLALCRVALALAIVSKGLTSLGSKLLRHAQGAETWYQASRIAKAEDARERAQLRGPR